MVYFCDKILVSFFGDLDAVKIERRAINDGGGAASGLDGRIQHGVHNVSVKMAFRCRTPSKNE